MPPIDHAGNPLCLLTVHAHPDDEASKGAGTVARYTDDGVRAVLVCCTGGEEGDILNPEADTPETRANLPAVRRQELDASVAIIGYSAVHLLGYRDSGMRDTEANASPDNFANAPLDEAVERLVRIVRAERPQVMIGYAEEQSFYPHPDHVRDHEITFAAFDAAGDPDRFPDSGEPWAPSKLYSVGFSVARVEAFHAAFERLGIESPYATWFERGFGARAAVKWTTLVDVSDYLERRRAALLAHRTQVTPDGHWMRLPDDVIRTVYPWEEYVLERSLVSVDLDPDVPEDDLFAGVRMPAPSGRER